MVDQDIKDASNARDDYALQQSVIALLSQHALLGGIVGKAHGGDDMLRFDAAPELGASRA